jgi:hypothetical protein
MSAFDFPLGAEVIVVGRMLVSVGLYLAFKRRRWI